VLAGERTLLEIAVRYGYTSGEAFARAFRAMHGVGPGEARRVGATLQSQPRMSFRLIVEGSSGMRYRVVEKEEFRVVGRKARVPLVHEGMNPAIAAFIRGIGQETLQRIQSLSDQEPEGIVSVSDDLDDSRAEGTELDYCHGVVTRAAVPEDMDALTVPAGTWAVFENSGPFPQALHTCGGTCSRSGSRPTRTGAGRGPRSCGPGCPRTRHRRTRSCGSPWSGPRSEGWRAADMADLRACVNGTRRRGRPHHGWRTAPSGCSVTGGQEALACSAFGFSATLDLLSALLAAATGAGLAAS
jgi:predicted transcriptional regulator YdeE